MANQNPDILALYQSLCAQQDALSAAIQNATDQKTATTISTEITEVSHRMILAQNLLFQSDNDQLAALVKSVGAASKNLTTAIGQIQNVTGFLNSMNAYLACVDEAIDLAKTLAAAAA